MAPPSSSTTPIRNLGLGYTTSIVHQSPFGGVNKWVRLFPHLLSHHLRIFHCKPLLLHPYAPWRSTVLLGELRSLGRPGTISLRKFKATFSTMVYELELKYGTNYTECSHSNNWPVMCSMRH
jgi:hypothetical protein